MGLVFVLGGVLVCVTSRERDTPARESLTRHVNSATPKPAADEHAYLLRFLTCEAKL